MSYRSPTTAMTHQSVAVRMASRKPPAPCDADVFGYLMDMGTGKSKVVLDEWGEMATSGGPRDLLLIAPAGSYKNWWRDKSAEQPSEINRHCDPEFRERLIDVGWTSGGSKDMRERIRLMMAAASTKRPRALFVNVEALSKVTKAIELCREFVEQRGAYVCVDESTTIKGKSKRTENVIDIGSLAAVKRILSGNWTPRSPLDLYYQCEFLDTRILGHPSYYGFRAKYAVLKRMDFGGRSVPVVVGYRNIDELQERTRRYSYRVLKKDCLDLEPKTYVTREVELTDEQREMISQIRLFGHAQIGDKERYVTTDSAIKQIMRLHQINCGFVMDDEERVIHEVPERRTDALVELLEEHGGKAIVWAPFRRSIEKIVKRLEEEFGRGCTAQFHGGNKSSRENDEKRFLSDPSCRFMVSTQAAGMRGNTWVVADLTVYYANNYDLEQREQSEDRNHRKGQTNKVTVVDLVATGTVDEKMVKNLKAKIVMGTMITGEELREWMI